jgi:hypothetical protein
VSPELRSATSYSILTSLEIDGVEYARLNSRRYGNPELDFAARQKRHCCLFLSSQPFAFDMEISKRSFGDSRCKLSPMSIIQPTLPRSRRSAHLRLNERQDTFGRRNSYFSLGSDGEVLDILTHTARRRLPEKQGLWTRLGGRSRTIREGARRSACSLSGSQIGRHKSGWRHLGASRSDHRVRRIERVDYEQLQAGVASQNLTSDSNEEAE